MMKICDSYDKLEYFAISIQNRIKLNRNNDNDDLNN